MSIDIQVRGTNGNNFWPGRAGHKPVAICNHIMQGTMESTLGWFRNPASEASAHYGVARDGRVWMFVDPANAAWANGIVQNPDLSIKWLAQAISDRINPNNLTISIEHEGNTGEPFPETQYQATLALHKLLIRQFNIVPDSQHIIRHSQIDSVKRPFCPGLTFPMDRLLKELNSMPQKSTYDFTDPVTKTSVTGAFANFYADQGGLKIFGRPISSIVQCLPGGRYNPAVQVQWFERARFELQPDGSIALGLVGRESYTGEFK